MHLELLCKPGLKSFPILKRFLELTSCSRSYFASDMVLISLYIKRCNKGGSFICKYPYWRCGTCSSIRSGASSIIYRVSQKFVPLISCAITFDQNFIFHEISRRCL